MMYKRLLALLVALALCFSLSACSIFSKEEQEESNSKSESQSDDVNQTEDTITPALYKVSSDNGTVIWLFGSIHIGEKDFYPLPDYVMDAFNSAEALAVEADIIAYEKNTLAQSEDIKMFMYEDFSTIDAHISEELYEEAKQILKDNNMYYSAMDYFCASLWANLIDNIVYDELGADVDLGIDRHLIKRANKKDKEIIEIESAAIQYEMMAGFSEQLQEYLLMSSIETYKNQENVKEELDELISLWKNGKVKKLDKLLNDVGILSKEEKELYKEYNEAMTVNRNIFMADFADKALKDEESIFICVGAAHVIGEGGMADILEKKGYKVELVE